MKNIILTIGVIAFCFSCQKKKSKVDEKWILLNDKNKIPVEINNFFAAYEGKDLKIANPNENFNESDVLKYRNAPFRQLRLLEKKNNIWRLVFIQGGIGKSYQFFEFKIQDDTISTVRKGYSIKNIETNDSLEYYIETGKMNFSDIKIKYKFD